MVLVSSHQSSWMRESYPKLKVGFLQASLTLRVLLVSAKLILSSMSSSLNSTARTSKLSKQASRKKSKSLKGLGLNLATKEPTTISRNCRKSICQWMNHCLLSRSKSSNSLAKEVLLDRSLTILPVVTKPCRKARTRRPWRLKSCKPPSTSQSSQQWSTRL